MKTDTRMKILEYIQTHSHTSPHELQVQFGLSGAAIHKQLRKLQAEHSIIKFGKPPRVFYIPVTQKDVHLGVIGDDLSDETYKLIEDSYLYVNPDGVILNGVFGFYRWAEKTHQDSNIAALAQEFSAVRTKANYWYFGKTWIEATEKLRQTFSDTMIDLVAYKDFYALPKFGKTKLGALTLHAKVSQSRTLMEQVAAEIREPIQEIIAEYQIEAVAFVPHSVPRLLPFLSVIRECLQLGLPEVKLEKIYQGEVRVAQKSLGKLEERVENAKKTIFLSKNTQYNRVLLIDDAVGSGATFNEIAKKLKTESQVQFIAGFAVVGSYKGFEVIQEV